MTIRPDNPFAQAPMPPPTDRELKELVRKHHVRWWTYPLQIVRNGELVTVGFEIELYGVHDHPAHPPEAGCDECLLVFENLRRIAEAVAARAPDATERIVEPYEPVILMHARVGQGDVRCRIQVVHHRDYDHVVDECERACVRQITDGLRALGAREERG